MKTALSETDLLKLQLANETQARLDLQMQSLQAQAQTLQNTLQVSQAKRTALIEQIKKDYALSEQDNVNLETGIITRAPVPETKVEEAPKTAKRLKKVEG